MPARFFWSDPMCPHPRCRPARSSLPLLPLAIVWPALAWADPAPVRSVTLFEAGLAKALGLSSPHRGVSLCAGHERRRRHAKGGVNQFHGPRHRWDK